MTQIPSHPHSAPLPEALIERILAALEPELEGARPAHVRFRDKHSNDLAAIRFADGRTLMAKRGRYHWAAERFETSRLASELLQQHTEVVAPQPLPLPEDIDERPLQVYWRIDLPTLEELWPSLSREQRDEALRSWGRLARQVHAVRLPGNGLLSRAIRERTSLGEFLRADLGERLLPAIAGEWTEALPLTEQTLELLPDVLGPSRQRGGHLVHNDFHMGNVLCRLDGEQVRCVGLLDLESAVAAAPEADLASAEVLHGPLFEMQVHAPLKQRMAEGYRAPADARLVALFRVSHLLNLGFYSALVGHPEHAALVGDAVRDELEVLRVHAENAA